MNDPERRYVFERAERLGMTVGEMSERMSYVELVEWMAFDTIRHAEAEKAQRLAEKGMSQKRPRRR